MSSLAAGHSDGNGNLPSCVAGFEVSHRLRDLVQREGPVDTRRYLARLDEFGEPFQVTGALLRQEKCQPLPYQPRQNRGAELPIKSSCQAAALLTTDDHDRPGGCECATQPGKCGVPSDIEDQVVAARPIGEVLSGVVDDMIGAQGSHKIEFGGATDAGDFGSQSLGQLYGVTPDAARGADDQHLLP